jgi:hypothetical protein
MPQVSLVAGTGNIVVNMFTVNTKNTRVLLMRGRSDSRDLTFRSTQRHLQ